MHITRYDVLLSSGGRRLITRSTEAGYLQDVLDIGDGKEDADDGNGGASRQGSDRHRR